MGLNLIISSLGIIQINRQRKQLAFKRIALINIASYLLASIIAIGLAFNDYGVWSLVALQILYGAFSVIMFWIITKWKPNWCFSFQSLRDLFGFGGYLLFSGVLQEICKNLQGLIIGRRFSSIEMGLYSQAKKLDDITSLTLPNVIVQVMFPVYSQIQNNLDRTREMLKMNIRVISFLIFPLMLLLIIIAYPLIDFLYGDKWYDAVPYFQILCVGGLFACLQNVNYYAVAAQGKSNVLFFWSFYKWGMLLLLLIIGMYWGMNGILWGMVISALNIYMVNVSLVAKYIHYSVKSQLKDVSSVAIISLMSAFFVYLIEQYLDLHFIICVFIYGVLYILFVFLFKLRVRDDIKLIIQIIHKK